jgi:sRNA-binding protein
VTSPKPILTLKGRARSSKKPVKPVKTVFPEKRDRPGRAVASKPKPPAPEPKVQSDVVLLADLQVMNSALWNPEQPQPLAVGVREQLYAAAEQLNASRKLVRRFLTAWTMATAYQQALTEPGARRHNLDGTVAGEVSEQHAEQARQRVEQRRRKAEAAAAQGAAQADGEASSTDTPDADGAAAPEAAPESAS